MKSLWGTGLLAVALCACGSDVITPPPPPPPNTGVTSIAVTVSSNAAMPRSGSAYLTVTVFRPNTIVEPIELSVDGLGSGVTAVFAPATIPASANTSALTLSAGPSAATGTYFATLTARAGSLASAIQLLVTVNP
jgi:hypothetical protein